MVEAALVLGLHEKSPLANEDAGEVHRAAGVIRRAVGLEALDVDVLGLVVVPARLGPERLAMAAVAVRLPAEELVPAFGRFGIEVDARTRFRRRQRELVEVQAGELRRHAIVVRTDGHVAEARSGRDRA